MSRLAVFGATLLVGVFAGGHQALAASAPTAALQVGLRAHGFSPGPIDGVRGPQTTNALLAFQRKKGLVADGRVGPATRRALGRRGRPLLGRRELAVGALGWDVAVLEFRLRSHGLRRGAIDGNFTRATSAALRRYQRRHALAVDGIAGPQTYRSLGRRAAPLRIHVVQRGESFFSIAARYCVTPWELARTNGIQLTDVIVPGQRFRLPAHARAASAGAPSRDTVRRALDYWARYYGVDPRLVRSLAWMESGFQQDVVSHVGAIGVLQLLPETWEFVDTVLLGVNTPRDFRGNVRAGVRYLRWQLDQFGGNVRLALAGWYQGARAVRQIGLYDDTKEFVRIVLALYGSV
jgi:soluble lytic murein transglycosylase-like protein